MTRSVLYFVVERGTLPLGKGPMLEPRNDPNSTEFWQRDAEHPSYIRLANGQLAYLPPKTTSTHEPTDDCDGTTIITTCVECGQALCSCFYGYGHDCEA